MPQDVRTRAERAKGYPPSPRVMVKKCTSVICGAPNPQLFDLVTDELLSYLNQPGLTAESLFKDFSDVTVSFPKPELHTQPPAAWHSGEDLGGWNVSRD